MKVSSQQRRKAAEIISRLMPSPTLYKKYASDAEIFMRDFAAEKKKYPKNMIEVSRFEMVKSRHFKRKYLVAFAGKGWFAQMAGAKCDAVASPPGKFLEINSPPLVIIPGKHLPKKAGFSSVMEHEFVHVNQMITTGQSPNLGSCALKPEILFDQLCQLTHFEFQANFVQLAHDQTLTPEFDVSLEEWACLRGFTSGLETAIVRLATEGRSLAHAKKFFRLIASDLPRAFKKLGLGEALGREFADDLHRLTNIALWQMQREFPQLEESPVFFGLLQWAMLSKSFGR